MALRASLLFFCLLGTFFAVGQNMQLLSYPASNGVEYKPGDLVYLGNASHADNFFQYIKSNYPGANNIPNLSSTYNGQFLEVRKIKQSGTRKSGYKVYLVCTSGPVNYWLEIEAAIEAGEVVVP